MLEILLSSAALNLILAAKLYTLWRKNINLESGAANARIAEKFYDELARLRSTGLL